MRRIVLVVVLAVIVLGLVVGDAMAKGAAESGIESAVRSGVSGVGSVTADIDSFPFTGRLVLGGEVRQLDLELTDVTGHGIDMAQLDLSVTGLKVDRGVVFGGSDVDIATIESVTLVARVTEAALRQASGVDVVLRDDEATVSIGGATSTAVVTVIAGRIQMSVAGQPPVSVAAPDSSVMPCPMVVDVVDGALRVSCTSDRLPSLIAAAVGSPAVG